jgi:predicted TIM-barrel fold metal-dependent hydrolase
VVSLAPPPIPGGQRGYYGAQELSKLVHDHPGGAAFVAGIESLKPSPIQIVPPTSSERGGYYGAQELSKLVHDHPGRFAFTAGGESLNPMIQRTPPQDVTPDLRRQFERQAEAILQAGAAGFGELAVEHFSARIGDHPYESAPADHPLFFVLADIAAKAGVPIEVHMEAVPHDMPFPNPRFAGPPNPPAVRENITAFERLLDYNGAARIVWLHAGWDLSGDRTVQLMRSLLSRHPNLYMTIKSDRGGDPRSSPFAPGGGLKPAWVSLLRDFPDRFVIGSDQFLGENPERIERARKIVDALPPELSRMIATDNVMRSYRLPASLR